MEQEADVGMKDVEPLTPFDWKERLLELAAGLDEQKTPAGCRAVVGLDAPTLTALAEAIDGLMRRNTERYKTLRGIARALDEHIMSDGIALMEITALIDGARKGGYL